MAVYTYANHTNNTLVREWCEANYGRSVALSEALFPNFKHPKTGLSKYKCGEQLITDEMLEDARKIMLSIEHDEQTGKRKIHVRKKRAVKLESNKYENYSEIEKTEEYKKYVEFHTNYAFYNNVFDEKFNFVIPLKPSPSNLMSAKFRYNLNKAKKYVEENSLKPTKVKSTYVSVKDELDDQPKTKLVKQKRSKVAKVAKVAKMSPMEEFEVLVTEIKNNPNISKLVPVVLMMEHSDSIDNDVFESMYNKFIGGGSFSILKLINLKKSYEKAMDIFNTNNSLAFN